MNFVSFPILFQSADFVALDKPAGISVHNNEDPQNVLGVLQNRLGVAKLYPVHRLDKETSGVQLIALKEKPAKSLAAEFEQRTVQKTYIGLLRGEIREDEGVWTHQLTDKSEGRVNPAGQPKDRVLCETRFRVLQRSKYFTLCEFDLITGRQHQIRKHAALAKHALVGDPRYGDAKYNGRMQELYKTSRLFLHCAAVRIAGHTIECPLPSGFNLIE